MKTAPAWAEAFGISAKQIQDWRAEAPQGGSLVYWAIQRDLISGEEYLNWAKEHYQLPVLKTDFFKKPIDFEFFKSIQGVANWSESLIPISQWQNMIYVACIEPLEETSWSFQVQYCLASPHHLETLWRKIKKETQMNSDLAKQPASSESRPQDPERENTLSEVTYSLDEETRPPLSTTGSSEESLLAVADFDLSIPEELRGEPPALEVSSPEGIDLKFELSDAVEQSEHSQLTDHEIPEGLNLDLSPEGLDLSEDLNIDPSRGSELPEAQEEAPEGLEMLDLNGAQTPSLNEDPFNFDEVDHSEPKVQLSEPKVEQVGQAQPEPPVASEVSHENNEEADSTLPPLPQTGASANSVSETEQDQELGDNSASTVTHLDSLVTKTEVLEGFEEGWVNSAEIAPSSLRDAKSEEEIYAWGFQALQKHFEKSMILLLQGDGKVSAYKWSQNWKPLLNRALDPVELTEPSPFRIVKKTGRPYHGRLANNKISEAFFEAWGSEELPPHATLAPLKIGAQMIGMTLSVGSKPQNSKQALLDAEKTADRMTDQLKQLTKAAA